MRSLWFALGLCILSACSLAPDYQRPPMNIPSFYKENSNRSCINPARKQLKQKAWWRMYKDPILNRLEKKVSCANQNLKVALAHYDAARAELNIARSDYFPTLLGVGNISRQKAPRNIANTLKVPVYNDNLLAATLNYEADVWGRVRNSVAAARDLAQASAADLAAVSLSLHAELAAAYFTLRGTDAEQQILNNVIIAYQEALDLVHKRYLGGIAFVGDVYQAQNQLYAAKTAATDLHLQRVQIEHAIAILVGETPATFCLKRIHYQPKLVTVATNLPSVLLERRPDILAAEWRVQAANANIGVARAAFFPEFNLAAAGGFESSAPSHLLRSSSLIWSLGPTVASALLNNSLPLITQTLFDGGKIRALSDQARVQYYGTVATYRQTVLTAFQQVEDSLIALRQLDCEYQSQTAATQAANYALTQALYRYKEGLTTYLDVTIAQRTALQAKLATINISARRQVSSVQLIKALGGGWSDIPLGASLSI